MTISRPVFQFVSATPVRAFLGAVLLTVGLAVGRRIEAPDGSRLRGAIQTDTAINPGNSGGPLLDGDGRVIGVISQGRGDGIAFAVPVSAVERLARRPPP